MSQYQFSFDLTDLQVAIMQFVSDWARMNKTPIPQKEVVLKMKEEEIKDFTTMNALNGLIKKGYIRKAYTISTRTHYVQIRSI